MVENSSSGHDLLRQAKQDADKIDVQQAEKLLDAGEARVVDVREGDEFRAGHLPGAVHVPRGFLDYTVESKLPDKSAPLIVYCAGGNRSALAIETMKKIGYEDLKLMAGGWTAWREAGLKVEVPKQWTERQRDRYSRHFVLPEVGEKGQQKLLDGKILVVGAGGLGSPILYYLAAAGVGNLGIVDFDAVEENNLQRQIIHSTSRIGTNKAESAAATISDLNPDVKVRVWNSRLEPSNVDEIVGDFDLVVDATDNFDTRYMLNEAAVKQGKAYVYGSIYRFEGYSSVFWPERGGPCYRCLHPEPPPPELAPT